MGGGGGLHLTRHCHYHSDPCTKISSVVNHFNVSLIVEEHVSVILYHSFARERKAEAESNQFL